MHYWHFAPLRFRPLFNHLYLIRVTTGYGSQFVGRQVTVYRMLRDGTLPAWHLGSRKLCTSWDAVRAFFGDGRAG